MGHSFLRLVVSVSLLAAALPPASALRICQQTDLCISFEHRNVSLPEGWGEWGAQRRFLVTASSADVCAGRLGLAAPLEAASAVLLLQGVGQACPLPQLLQATAGYAGLILADDVSVSQQLAAGVMAVGSPAVLVSVEEGQQIQYLARVVGLKVPVSVDLFRSPTSQYVSDDLLEEVSTYRQFAPIGLPLLTALFRHLSRGLRSSENNMHLMLARYQKAMSADWSSRPTRAAGVGRAALLEADLQAMEDFALQTASYFIVLVVAAMLGAVGAHVLTSTSRRMREAAVAQLPTEPFFLPQEEPSSTDSSSSSSSRASRQRSARSRSPLRADSGPRGKGVACRICLAAFREGENLTRLPCDHLFHGNCARPWLTDSSPCCPICQHLAM